MVEVRPARDGHGGDGRERVPPRLAALGCTARRCRTRRARSRCRRAGRGRRVDVRRRSGRRLGGILRPVHDLIPCLSGGEASAGHQEVLEPVDARVRDDSAEAALHMRRTRSNCGQERTGAGRVSEQSSPRIAVAYALRDDDLEIVNMGLVVGLAHEARIAGHAEHRYVSLAALSVASALVVPVADCRSGRSEVRGPRAGRGSGELRGHRLRLVGRNVLAELHECQIRRAPRDLGRYRQLHGMSPRRALELRRRRDLDGRRRRHYGADLTLLQLNGLLDDTVTCREHEVRRHEGARAVSKRRADADRKRQRRGRLTRLDRRGGDGARTVVGIPLVDPASGEAAGCEQRCPRAPPPRTREHGDGEQEEGE